MSIDMTILSYASQNPVKGVGYVYKWTNLINGMMYIGSTAGGRLTYVGSGKRFRHAVKKYGIENFSREILYSGPSYYHVECEILQAIDAARDANKWYNLTNNEKYKDQVAQSAELRARKREANLKFYTAEVRAKISEKYTGEGNPRFGVNHTEESLDKMRKAKIGENNPRYGVEVSEETRAKLKASLTGHTVSDETREKLRVSNHTRWHVNRNLIKAGCIFCTSEAS